MAVRQAPNPDKLSLDEIAGQAQDHVEDIYEWTVVEEKKLSGEPPLEPFEALCQRIENGLKGQALELFRFLKGRTQWTRFDTLADERRLWRGCDSPSNQAVTKALKRLVSKLVRLHAHCDLEIRAKEGRTKLTFYEPGRR